MDKEKSIHQSENAYEKSLEERSAKNSNTIQKLTTLISKSEQN